MLIDYNAEHLTSHEGVIAYLVSMGCLDPAGGNLPDGVKCLSGALGINSGRRIAVTYKVHSDVNRGLSKQMLSYITPNNELEKGARLFDRAFNYQIATQLFKLRVDSNAVRINIYRYNGKITLSLDRVDLYGKQFQTNITIWEKN